MATYGERLAGVSFNPSGDKDVDRVKRLCAELMDFCHAARGKDDGHERAKFYTLALDQLLLAQMVIVKAITWKED